MTANEPRLLGAADVRALLVELGTRLDAQGIKARVFLVVGAAMALAFDSRRVTRDIDAVFVPKREVYDEAARIASDRGLPAGWLNDGVKGLLPDREQPVEGTASFSALGIRVGVASAEYLFAMKAVAARQEIDGADLRLLAGVLGITELERALELVERLYGAAQLTAKTRLILADVLAAATAPDAD